MTSPVPTAREVVDTLLRSITTSFDQLAELYAPDVLIEMPFAPPLYPARRQASREDLRAQLKSGAAERTYTSVQNVTVHETTDPEVVIAEYELHGNVLADGREFLLPMLMIITVRDGLIVSSRDYNHPIASAQALGRVPELIAALTS